MRYAQGGDFTEKGHRRREQVRISAVEKFEQHVPAAEIAAELRVTERSVRRWRQAWEAEGAAGLACYRPGHRSRFIYRLHEYRGRKGEPRAFAWTEYRDLLIAAGKQLPGGAIVLIWDNLNMHTRAELRAFTGTQPRLRVFQLPPYAPDLNPVEGAWSVLKRGVLANLATVSFAHLLRVIRHGLKKIQHCPGLIEGFLAETGLVLDLTGTDITI